MGNIVTFIMNVIKEPHSKTFLDQFYELVRRITLTKTANQNPTEKREQSVFKI